MADSTTYGGVPVQGLTLEKLLRVLGDGTWNPDTLNPDVLIVGTDPGGSQPLRVGGAAYIGATLTIGEGYAINLASTGGLESVLVCEGTTFSITADPMTDTPVEWIQVTVDTVELFIPCYTQTGS